MRSIFCTSLRSRKCPTSRRKDAASSSVRIPSSIAYLHLRFAVFYVPHCPLGRCLGLIDPQQSDAGFQLFCPDRAFVGSSIETHVIARRESGNGDNQTNRNMFAESY